MSSFLEDLKALSNPLPRGIRIEDEDILDSTRAQLVDKSYEHAPGLEEENIDAVGQKNQKSGRKMAISLADSDPKYSGRVVSRSLVFGSETAEFQSNSADYSETSDVESGFSDDQNEEESSSEDAKVLSESDNEDISDKEPQVSHKLDLESQREKGESVKAQLALWDKLLGLRIRMQKVCGLVNQLPQSEEAWNDFQNDSVSLGRKSGSDQGLEKCRREMLTTLRKLVKLQDGIYSNSSELSKLLQESDHKNVNGKREREDSSVSYGEKSNEEIITSSDDNLDEKYATEVQQSKKRRKISIADFPKVLARRHEAYRNYRNDVLLKWFERTRLASGKFSAKKDFSALETNVLTQIEQILTNRQRLISRTQTKRSEYDILGNKDKTPERLSLDMEKSKQLDPEIFDDDDFYQQLLRELIDRKGANLTDSSAISRLTTGYFDEIW